MVNGRRRRNQDNPEEIKKIIGKISAVDMLKNLSAKEFADEGGYADIIAKNSGSLNTTQLRKFFGAIRDIEKEKDWKAIETEFYLLKPKLAYAVGRDLIKKPFYNFMMVCMGKVDLGTEEEKIENFKTMVNFLEAVVAYHKFYNAKSG